jgi:hypothetical protein
MNPPIEDSIVLARPNCWLLGSRYVCELIVNVPNDAIASWEAGGDTYCICKPSEYNGDLESNCFHHAGTSAAVWNIRGTVHRVDRTKALLEWGPYSGGQASGPHRDPLPMPRVETS